jgi:hypothetical protein
VGYRHYGFRFLYNSSGTYSFARHRSSQTHQSLNRAVNGILNAVIKHQVNAVMFIVKPYTFLPGLKTEATAQFNAQFSITA